MANYFSDSHDSVYKQLNSWQKSQFKFLNPDQQKAFCDIVEWEAFGKKGGHILIGPAGTGKTTTLRLITDFFRCNNDYSDDADDEYCDVVLCAPTNKAVKELVKLDTGVNCCTIYSLLGLAMEEYEDSIRLVRTDESSVHNYNIIIIDECGMINEELFGYIQAVIDDGKKVLFVGDPEQLPPVGEKYSKVWDSYECSKLTKVMRHDNQILDFATHVRKLKTLDNLKLRTNNDRTEGVWYLDKPDFIERIQKYARNGHFNSDTKALAWRNKIVEKINIIVRDVVFGEDAELSRYLIGDKVVFTKPFKNTVVKISTDDEAIVKKVRIDNHPDYSHLLCYYLKLEFDSGFEFEIKTLHEDAEAYYQNVLSELAADARRPKNSHVWEKFWELKRSLCELKYSYALTVHRSQGSTYKNVFVDTGDILRNYNKDEAKKCLYVATTRPSKKLFLT